MLRLQSHANFFPQLFYFPLICNSHFLNLSLLLFREAFKQYCNECYIKHNLK